MWEEDMEMCSKFLKRKVINIRLLTLDFSCCSCLCVCLMILKIRMYMSMLASLWQEELKADHASYLRKHPEIRTLVSDFLQFLLLRKPEDVFKFARDYFLPSASHNTSLPGLTAQKL